MIIVSPAVALSEAEADLPNNPLIGWHNVITAGSLVAETADTAYPVVNLANDVTPLFWQGADDSEQHVTITPGVIEVDYVGIARHNFGSAQITVTLDAIVGPGEDRVTLAEQIFATDRPAIFRIPKQAYSEIRLGFSSGLEPPRLAHLHLGRLTVLQRRIYVGHTPIPYGRQTTIVGGTSEDGSFLGRIVLGETLQTSVSLQNLTPVWYRETFEPFVVAARTKPFFFAWRPESYPKEVGFAWLTNNPRPTNQRSNGMMSVDLQMGGIA